VSSVSLACPHYAINKAERYYFAFFAFFAGGAGGRLAGHPTLPTNLRFLRLSWETVLRQSRQQYDLERTLE
jgi:hypothetical protein